MNDTILYTQNLDVGYRLKKVSKTLISNINVSMKRGQFTCLLGQNGVGKSTLLRTLLNLQNPLSGDIYYNNRPIQQYKKIDLSKMVSVVLTEPILAGNLSVWELVALGRAPYTAWNGTLRSEDWDKVQWAIDVTRINYIEQNKISTLSDGQLQKALIARALAQDCPLIIMDEPTAHLDLNNRVEIMRLLKELSEKTQKAILVATHELQLTLQLADKLWLTNFKHPLISGTPEDLALSGDLENTFYHEDFDFDLITGRATVYPNARKEISVKGDGDWLYWTKNALIRKGYKIVGSESPMIEQSSNNHWKITTSSGILEKDSIDNLLEYLKDKD